MYNTKVIQTLKELNEDELKAFVHYVNSPLFNTNKRCIQLLELLKSAAPTYTSEKIKHDRIFKIMFSAKSTPSALRSVTSLLFNLLKNFLTLLQFQKNPFYQDQMLLEALEEKSLNKFVEKNLDRIIPKYLGLQESSINYYQRYQLNEFKTTFQKALPKRKKKQENIDYLPVLEDFYTYSLWNKLKYWTTILNDCINGLETIYNKNLLQATINEAQQYDLNANPGIQLWYFSVLLLDTSDPQYFDLLKELLEVRNGVNIIRQDIILVYTILLNYCNRQVVAGQLNYNLEIFDLYSQMIAKKLLYVGKYIPHRHIKNIVTIGLQTGRFEETLQFIEDYKTEVDPEIRESVYQFNLGAWHFYQKHYDKALEHLIKVGKIGVYYDLDYQALILKSYYELTDADALVPFIDSYKNFVKNNKKIPKDRQKAYSNFINLTRHLFRVKALYSSKSPSRLKDKIQSTALISDKVWLLEKVNELI